MPATGSLPCELVPRPALPAGPYLVAGFGRAGRAVIPALLAEVAPDQIAVWDRGQGRALRRQASRLERLGIRVQLGGHPDRRMVKTSRCLIKSPGVDPYASVMQRAQHHGLEVVDELEIGWRRTRCPVIAVTGTNGKSTVSGLITAVLEASGARVQLAGNTEFGPPLSGATLGLDALVCEVSSFQLEFCDRFLPELAVFTNLTPEHLGRHRTMDRYGAIKRRLFVRGTVAVARAVIDIDGPFGSVLADELEQLGSQVRRVGYARRADFRISSAGWNLRRSTLQIDTPRGAVALTAAFPGAHNARNVAAGLAAADLLGVEPDRVHRALTDCRPPPGRLEHVDANQPFSVIVDFAHTPDGVSQMLSAVRGGKAPGSKLIVVLGLASRPGTALREMARLSRASADRLILTTSGYNAVPPMPALAELMRGARSVPGAELEVQLDRRRAFRRAFEQARPGDVVVIPGRGAINVMDIDPRGDPIPFVDREVAGEELSRLTSR